MRTRAWQAAVISLLCAIGWGVMSGDVAGPAGQTDAAGTMALLGFVFGLAAWVVPIVWALAEWSGSFRTR